MSLASFAGILLLALNPNNPDTAAAPEQGRNWAEFGATFANTDHVTGAGIETAFGFGARRVDYFINSPLVLTFVKRQDTWRYSFQGPMNFIAWMLAAGVGQIAPMPVAAPVAVLLNVWNSRYQVRLTDHIGASLGLSTEYLFYTTNGAARGVELSPSAGLSFDIPHGPDRWRILLSARHSSFLDMNGPNSDDGFGFDIRIVFDGRIASD